MNNTTVDYEHITCDSCDGVIGMYDREHFECDKCGKQFATALIKYDRLLINHKTGWIFPVNNKTRLKNRDKEE